MQLERPIVFFDLETTGVNLASDNIVEISMLKLLPGGRRESITLLVNPSRRIPKGASAVHGITDDMVKTAPKFQAVAGEIADFFLGCDIGGFNCQKFDIPLLGRQMTEAGLTFPEEGARVVDVMKIYHKKNPRDLAAAYQRYCGKSLEGAHRAEADIVATLEVFLAQIKEHPDLGSLREISAYCSDGDRWADHSGKLKMDKDGDVVFAFGKHSGQKVKDQLEYAAWMMKSDFPSDTKQVLKKVLEM